MSAWNRTAGAPLLDRRCMLAKRSRRQHRHAVLPWHPKRSGSARVATEHFVAERRRAAAMALHERVKTALDETRTLILGAQILLGFQYQGVFQERFETLPPHARAMDGGVLGLMLLAMGLLIATSAFHRLAEGGESTGRMHALTGRCAAAALLPFAVALGLDLAIALEHVLGGPLLAGAVGIGFALLALAGWQGAGEVMKRRQGAAERRCTRGSSRS
jgi:Family of unknown function (DUF6328)